MKSAGLVALALVAGLLVTLPARSAHAITCPPVTPYPGDTASQADTAVWMARAATAVALPGELPVMGALVESGLKNLSVGDGDTAGFFQMRVSIWDNGAYIGFPGNPDLQLRWFLDQATAVRANRLAAGLPDPALDEAAWGEWAADVLRPAEQYRYRYQLRLADARALIGPPCTPPDVVAPLTQVDVKPRQKPRVVRLAVVCPAEACTASASGTVMLGKRPRLSADLKALSAGQQATLRLPLRPRVRRLVSEALARHRMVRVKVTVTTADLAGNVTTLSRRVRLTLVT